MERLYFEDFNANGYKTSEKAYTYDSQGNVFLNYLIINNMNNKYFLILTIFMIWSCSNNSETEKYQYKRDNITYVKKEIKEIDFKDVFISSFAHLYTTKEYLLISDYRTIDKLIYIFNKNNYNFISNVLDIGQGPGEIANLGFVGTKENDNIIYVTDNGKQKIFEYDLDSIQENPLYIPTDKMTLNNTQFPFEYQYMNEALSMGVMMEPTGNSGFIHSVAKFNFNTGEIKTMKYIHPKIEKKRVCFAVSIEHKIYVECYKYNDLMTICDMDGNLICNVYGKKWNNKATNKYGFYNNVVFCHDKILVSFSDGKDRYSDKESEYPTQFLIFNTKGDYIKTLETEYAIKSFCYDEDNNRLIMHLDEEIQFAFLELNGILQ